MSSLLQNVSSLYNVQSSLDMWLTFKLACISRIQTNILHKG